MIKIAIEKLDWDKVNGLVPVVIQDENTLQVLMLGYMNKKSLKQTIKTGLVTFYSRERQCLWQKGETSGNMLTVVNIVPDCDNDTLLIVVNPVGPTCHLGTVSCFGNEEIGWLAKLENIIGDRYQNRDKKSYTSSLFNKGVNRIAQKVGEEAVETVIAAVSDDKNFPDEAADLIYHLLVLLKAKQMKLADVIEVLRNRGKEVRH